MSLERRDDGALRDRLLQAELATAPEADDDGLTDVARRVDGAHRDRVLLALAGLRPRLDAVGGRAGLVLRLVELAAESRSRLRAEGDLDPGLLLLRLDPALGLLRDGRVRWGRVRRPGCVDLEEPGRDAAVARGVGRADLERIAAVGERRGRVGLAGAGAGPKGAAAYPALEGRRVLIGGGECEGRGPVGDRADGSGVDVRVRCDCVDGECALRRFGILVRRRVDRPDVEGVDAIWEWGDRRIGTRARCITGVEPALEGGVRFGGGEVELRRGVVDQSRRAAQHRVRGTRGGDAAASVPVWIARGR